MGHPGKKAPGITAAVVAILLFRAAPALPVQDPAPEAAARQDTAEALQRVDALLLALRPGDARAALEPVADRASYDPGVAVRLGRILAGDGDLQGAMLQLRAAVLLAPDDAEARLALGEAYLDAHQVAEAMEELRRASELAGARSEAEPRAARPLLVLGVSLQRLGDLAGSSRALERAVALDGKNPEALYRLGVTELLASRWSDAAATLTRALAIDDGLAPAYFSRALAASRLGNGTMVVDDMKRFLELAPDAPQAAQARAVVETAASRATPPATEAKAPPPA